MVRENPGRVLAVYVRNVSRDPARVRAIEALAGEVAAAGSGLLLAADSVAMAEHAAARGLIGAAALARCGARGRRGRARRGRRRRARWCGRPRPRRWRRWRAGGWGKRSGPRTTGGAAAERARGAEERERHLTRRTAALAAGLVVPRRTGSHLRER